MAEIRGTFNNYNNTKTYFVQIGSGGNVIYIQDNADTTNGDNIICFAGESPVTISSDMSDTFEHVYIRSCTINLVSNFDVRPLVVANNFEHIPVKIRYNDMYGDLIFDGWVQPLSFNQPFALKWNEFSLDCVDRLGILENISLYELTNGNTDLISPYDIMTIILGRAGFSINTSIPSLTNLVFDIVDDYTTTTLVNPVIFNGDGENEDDYMKCDEVLEEIGKIYGCYFYQDGGTCKVTNLLRKDLTNPQQLALSDYMGDDTNISVDNAYNRIKCEVDISSIDDTIADPFDSDYITSTTDRAERVLTELIETGIDHLGKAINNGNVWHGTTNSFIQHCYQAKSVTRWDSPTLSSVGDPNFKVHDHYCQIKENELFDFGTSNYLNDGHGSDTTDAWKVLKWLKDNPGKGAFLSFGVTENIRDPKNNATIKFPDMKNALVISIDGHGDDADWNYHNYNQESARLKAQTKSIIQNNMLFGETSGYGGICGFKLNSVNNITPADKSVTNYMLINCSIRLNPIVERTGEAWEHDTQLNYGKVYTSSFNNLTECYDSWENLGVHWDVDYLYKNMSFYGRTVVGKEGDNDDDKRMYFQSYCWDNIEPMPTIPDTWPYNQTPNLTRMITKPYSKIEKTRYKFHGVGFEDIAETENDMTSKVPILACELKIGDKYLVEDFRLQTANRWHIPVGEYNNVYCWKTYEELQTEEDGQGNLKWVYTDNETQQTIVQTWFSIGIDPKVNDTLIGQEFSITDTVDVTMGLNDAKGFAIPIPFSANLSGKMTFKILGPYNIYLDKESEDTKFYFLFYDCYTSTHKYLDLLAETDNIIISELSFKLVSDNGKKEQQNDENDLVYYSDNDDTFQEEKDFDCDLCTSLTRQQFNDLGVDYNLNNSNIMKAVPAAQRGEPWYGMNVYDGHTYSGDENLIKLEEARVKEQYDIWKKPRNILETTLKLRNPELANFDTNFTFDYVTGTYQTTAREIDLKQNTMTCTMKDFS